MARNNRAVNVRRNSGTARNSRAIYVDGSAAKKLQEVPDRKYYRTNKPSVQKKRTAQNRRKTSTKRPVQRQLDPQTMRNREQATRMGRGFVVFIAAVSVAILLSCIFYLQLKSDITAQMKHVATLESELSELKEDNDANYNHITSNIDLNSIKKIAIGRLGMKYPSENQIRTYKTEAGGYLRQYQEVPDLK